jgi:hypothetical protein
MSRKPFWYYQNIAGYLKLKASYLTLVFVPGSAGDVLAIGLNLNDADKNHCDLNTYRHSIAKPVLCN